MNKRKPSKIPDTNYTLHFNPPGAFKATKDFMRLTKHVLRRRKTVMLFIRIFSLKSAISL
jgi:hypothetical protein